VKDVQLDGPTALLARLPSSYLDWNSCETSMVFYKLLLGCVLLLDCNILLSCGLGLSCRCCNRCCCCALDGSKAGSWLTHEDFH
jgi:hypothetical protein